MPRKEGQKEWTVDYSLPDNDYNVLDEKGHSVFVVVYGDYPCCEFDDANLIADAGTVKLQTGKLPSELVGIAQSLSIKARQASMLIKKGRGDLAAKVLDSALSSSTLKNKE